MLLPMNHTLIAAVVALSPLLAGVVSAEQWQERSSDHFVIFYLDDEDLAKQILEKAEGYYSQIAHDLGYPRYSEFWTWDNRAKIYLYPTHGAFLKATGEAEWSQGMADYKKREICGYAGSRDFVNSILPHEMTHLIFRDFVGFKGEVPLWLDEGVAQWHEQTRRDEVRSMIKKRYASDQLLALEDMMKTDIRTLKYKETLYIRPIMTKKGADGVLFLSGDAYISLYYLQAVSLVDFLITSFGTDTFAHFCRQLRDGKSLIEALSFAYPAHIRNIQELEDGWRKYIEEKT